MIPRKVLIVDGNAVCYAAYYSVGKLSYEDKNTGVIYGFFSQVEHACRLFGTAHIAYCWDSKQSIRKRLFPDYKSNRKKGSSELLTCLTQINRIRREILPRLRFTNNFHEIGFEADDLIARLCQTAKKGQEIAIMSNDQDLYQLLNEHVSIYKPSKGKIYNIQDFTKEYGIQPSSWPDIKAIAGCRSDAIPGIPGIGEIRALKFITGTSSDMDDAKIKSAEGQKIWARNLELIKLPLLRTPDIELDFTDLPSFAEWISVCEELGFESFLRNSQSWISIFAGIPPPTTKEKTLSKIKITNNKER